MIEGSGTVIAVEGEWAQVVARPAGCNGCAGGTGCGLMGRFLPSRPAALRARNPIGAQVGERVAFGLRPSSLLRLAALAYLVPAMALILGGALGEAIGGDQRGPAGLLGATAGLGLAFWGLRLYSVHLARCSGYQPVILRRLDGPDTVPPDGS